MPSPYDVSYLPRARAGILVNDSAISASGISGEGAGILSTVNIIGSALTTTANAVNYITFLNGADLSEIRGVYTVANTGFVASDFNLYISTLFAGFLNFANGINWGTGSNVVVTAANYGIYGTLTVGATSVNLTAVTPNPIPEGRIVIPDFQSAFVFDGNQQRVDSYRLPVAANTNASTLASGGVSMTQPWISAYNMTGVNSVQPSDRFSVLKSGIIYVSPVVAIPTIATSLFVETAVGVNQGRITPTASGTTVALPAANYSLMDVSGVGGLVQLKVNLL